MKGFSLGLILLLGAVPLAACNQQNNRHGFGAHGRHAGGMFNEGRRGLNEGRRGERGRLREACASEVTKYCSGMDRPRLQRRCLESHLDQLSADCKTAVESRGGGRRRRDQ
jgi:hypothetical protein